MRSLAVAIAVALGLPALALAQDEGLPPPPPPPAYDGDVPLPPPPSGTRPLSQLDPQLPRPAPAPARRPAGALPPSGAVQGGAIGESPIAAAGAQAAPLHPDETIGHWRYAMASGVAGRFGGMQLDKDRENPGVLLYFGAQADGLWSEGFGKSARLRLRMFTGGESEVYLPSDGEVEGAFMIGRREFRFVLGRLEVARYPALGMQVLAQLATLPCFEGSLPLLGDTMRLYYYVSPVEASFVRYYGDAHISHSAAWATESDVPVAASAGRLRWTLLLPPSVLLSLQGDLMKMWNKADLLLAGEASLGYQVLEGSAVFNVAVRWDQFRRRGLAPETSATDSEMKLLGIATLVF
ncbi:hypothetical protein [Anaeromyxobacter terrae]|uniref:hypothetical protein n=1 Tax=Anaeromyxobacter terrae TaxID=2925406 RepID=UPI001F573BD9|nr:hypothetical protein [Anaeromyxobacter sp. SG22]